MSFTVCFSRAAVIKTGVVQVEIIPTVAAREVALQVAIGAHFRGNNKDIFSGLNEILKAETALEDCLSLVNLLMSKDR